MKNIMVFLLIAMSSLAQAQQYWEEPAYHHSRTEEGCLINNTMRPDELVAVVALMEAFVETWDGHGETEEQRWIIYRMKQLASANRILLHQLKEERPECFLWIK